MLTIDDLKEMQPGEIFKTGTAMDTEDGLFMVNTGRELRWIAIRGHFHDWAIYCHFSDRDISWICSYGDKVHMEHHIKKLVPCTDEAFALYRH